MRTDDTWMTGAEFFLLAFADRVKAVMGGFRLSDGEYRSLGVDKLADYACAFVGIPRSEVWTVRCRFSGTYGKSSFELYMVVRSGGSREAGMRASTVARHLANRHHEGLRTVVESWDGNGGTMSLLGDGWLEMDGEDAERNLMGIGSSLRVKGWWCHSMSGEA